MECVLILAMQLMCTSQQKVACIDNESLAQLLYVRVCQELLVNANATPSVGLSAQNEDNLGPP
jgi:hypothetical protein